MVATETERILDVVRRYWGYDALRPLQEEAILAGLSGRDSLVVLPTGGGKSLCYQVPPILAEETAVVVSPLIALMKDQVDGLSACGVPAAAFHSNLDADDRREIRRKSLDGDYRLLFVSPERLVRPGFLDFLRRAGVRSFAIDEAHCISHWGHDFRQEYRMLASVRERFPDAGFHAFTATATERVRRDIVEQLNLSDPEVLVGRFDRPNLVYRVLPKVNVSNQIIDVLGRHHGEAAIVYCISRKQTESLAEKLQSVGIRAKAYHAGMGREERTRTQEEFAEEKLDVVVATVAFGMGIDRNNVRCVIHASMPKSVEHYQQETGRAGRDGLEAECVLFYSVADVIRWEELVARSVEEGVDDLEEGMELIAAAKELLGHMKSYGGTLRCRHRVLSEYFGQEYGKESCEACDVCLSEADEMPESTVAAQKILSCVARVDQRFGVGYVAQVLTGADTEAIRNRGHEELSTYGLLADLSVKAVTNLIYQLVDQELLVRTSGDRPILRLNAASLDVLKGRRDVKLLAPKTGRAKRTRVAEESWEGVDRGLFEHLRSVRRRLSEERGVPAYVIFDDRTLRGLARMKPGNLVEMSRVKGVGEKKLADLGQTFLDAIAEYEGE